MNARTVLTIAGVLGIAGGSAIAQAPGGGRPLDPRQFPRMMQNAPLMGAIRQIDPARNAIQVQAVGPEGPQERWIGVTPETVIMVQGNGTLADLKLNDTIVVMGFPTTITAAQIQIGGAGGAMGGMRGGPGGFPGGPGQPPAGGAFAPPPAAPPGSGLPNAAPGTPPAAGGNAAVAVPSDLPRPPAALQGAFPNAGPGGGMMGGLGMARVTGTVVSTRPLILQLPGNMRVTVNAEPTTRIAKTARGTLADLRIGDTIRAFGRPDENGNLIAMRVDAGVEMMGPGFGAFGGAAPGPPQIVPVQPGQQGNF